MFINGSDPIGTARGEPWTVADDHAGRLPDPWSRSARNPDRTMTLNSAAVSSAGPRADNQDSGCAGAHLVAVADGVGGNVGGAIASSLVIKSLARYGCCDTSSGELGRAIATANRRICAAYNQRPELKSMATTLTVLATTRGGGLALAHIGDSRAYLSRAGALVQLTRDHTWVQALVDAGGITPERALSHPLRSVLLAVLHGSDEDPPKVEITTLTVRPGDRLLVCSDGLSGAVDDEQIRCILATEHTPAAAAAGLLRAALDAPAQDNVTVAVADVTAPAPSPCGPAVTVGAAASRGEQVTAPLPIAERIT
jgi:serine/threonine protein phosphatase PrpC